MGRRRRLLVHVLKAANTRLAAFTFHGRGWMNAVSSWIRRQRRRTAAAEHGSKTRQASANESPRKEVSLLRSPRVVASILLAVLGGLSGVAATYLLAGQQEVRAQGAAEEVRRRHDSAVPPFRVEGASFDAVTSFSSPRILELADQRLYPDDLKKVENWTEVGQILGSAIAAQAQPTVYKNLGLTLVGQRYAPVAIIGIRARIIARDKPPAGTLVYAEPQGGADVVSGGIDLDSRDLDAKVMDGLLPSSQSYFDRKYVTLARDEPVVFELVIFTAKCLCDFVLDITLSDRSVVSIDDNGKPWRIAGFSATYERSYIAVYTSTYGGIRPCSWPLDCRHFFTRHHPPEYR